MKEITKHFLDAADKFADIERRGCYWKVWPKYAIHSQANGGRYVSAVTPDVPPANGLKEALEQELEKTGGEVPRGSRAETLMRQAIEQRTHKKAFPPYLPLVRYPDLFLTFARLADEDKLDNAATADELDTDKNATAALEWAETFGVLGLTSLKQLGVHGDITRGGRAETVSAFAHEAWVANGCLRLYEAATAKELDIDVIAAYMPVRRRAFLTQTPARARESALNAVAIETQARVAGNAYPALYGEVGRFIQGWAFTNLLGAMWLQMFWLLTATREPSRCRNPECDKIIAYQQPVQSMRGTKRNDRSGGYRTRKDKKFCDRKCRNRYNYLTTTKPRRRATRGS